MKHTTKQTAKRHAPRPRERHTDELQSESMQTVQAAEPPAEAEPEAAHPEPPAEAEAEVHAPAPHPEPPAAPARPSYRAGDLICEYGRPPA